MAKKKRYIVVPRSEKAMMEGLRTGKRHLKFGKQTAKWISDPAEAREIDTHYGLKGSGDVWVEQDENLEWHENNDGLTDGRKLGIHKYTFSQMGTNLLPREKVVGMKKVINGVTYIYVMEGSKIRLIPYKAQK